MSKILNFIPGYRSGKGWKIAVATIYYILSILMSIMIEEFGSLLMFFSLPFILFGFATLIKQKKPSTLVIGIIAFIIGAMIVGFSMDDEMSTSDTQPTVTAEAIRETLSPSPEPTQSPTDPPTPEPTEISSEFSAEEIAEMEENDRKEMERSEYIGSCQSVTYDELARNPEYYKGKRIGLYGEVMQYQESGLNVTMLICVTLTNTDLDLWDDIVYVTYTKSSSKDSRFLEGDKIWVYGTYQGIKSYKIRMGGTNQVPYIQAKYTM